MHNQWQSQPPKNQQPPLQPPPQTTSTITGSSNKFQIQKPHQNKIKLKIKKKKNQNLQQNPNPTDQSMTKLNQPLAARAVEDDEQRSASFNQRVELQILNDPAAGDNLNRIGEGYGQ